MLTTLLFLLSITIIAYAADEKKKLISQIAKNCKQETYGTKQTSSSDKAIINVIQNLEKQDPEKFKVLAAHAQKQQENARTTKKS